jgi:hypothetical protein
MSRMFELDSYAVQFDSFKTILHSEHLGKESSSPSLGSKAPRSRLDKGRAARTDIF